MKNKKLIINLKKFSIFLLSFNFVMIRFNILSPIELKIFADKNNILINIIYIILCIYSILYFINWVYDFYSIKRKSRKYVKMK